MRVLLTAAWTNITQHNQAANGMWGIVFAVCCAQAILSNATCNVAQVAVRILLNSTDTDNVQTVVRLISQPVSTTDPRLSILSPNPTQVSALAHS